MRYPPGWGPVASSRAEARTPTPSKEARDGRGRAATLRPGAKGQDLAATRARAVRRCARVAGRAMPPRARGAREKASPGPSGRAAHSVKHRPLQLSRIQQDRRSTNSQPARKVNSERAPAGVERAATPSLLQRNPIP